MVLPELNNEFAKNEGAETVEELKRNVKTNQQAYKEQQEELRIKQELFDNLVKGSDFEPPESIIDLELKFMIEGMKFQIQQSGMKLEDSGFDEGEAKKESSISLFHTGWLQPQMHLIKNQTSLKHSYSV